MLRLARDNPPPTPPREVRPRLAAGHFPRFNDLPPERQDQILDRLADLFLERALRDIQGQGEQPND